MPITQCDKRFIYTEKRTSGNDGLRKIYHVFRGHTDNYIGVIGRVRGNNRPWIAFGPGMQSAMTNFPTRKSAAEFLSAMHAPFKQEISAACKALAAEMQSPEFQQALEEA